VSPRSATEWTFEDVLNAVAWTTQMAAVEAEAKSDSFAVDGFFARTVEQMRSPVYFGWWGAET
jgi:hypothetical protein